MAASEIDTGTDHLRCHRAGRVAVVTLNRPDARNALSREMKQALQRLVPLLAADTEVGCVLLTGAGAAFCAGGDTRLMAQGPPPSREERVALLHREHEVPAALHRMSKPTLAALPGPAAGAGLALALACDLRIAAESAFVTTAYLRLGLSGDYGGSWFLTRLVGPARARELYLSSDRVDARTCERIGLVNRVVPDSKLASDALAWAAQLGSGPPTALRYAKDNLNRALQYDLEACLEVEAERMVASAQTEDHREAVRAWTEKRTPVFRGE